MSDTEDVLVPQVAVVKGHTQKLSLHLIETVPEHEPRESDPYYKVFRQTKHRMRDAGLLVCAIQGCHFGGPIELHHDKVEFAFQGGVDLDKFNDYYGLTIANDDEFRRYIEGPGNLEPLCLHGDTPVLMASGEWRPIGSIRRGEYVMGGDGRGHEVLSTASRAYDGRLVVMGGVGLTPDHLVRTTAGWTPAGLCGEARGVRVFSSHVRGMARVEPQVFDPVIELVPVDMVDSLGWVEPTPEMLLHDVAVFQNDPALFSLPYPEPSIAGWRHAHYAVDPASWLTVERGQPAGVGAIADGSASVDTVAGETESRTALRTDEVVPDDAFRSWAAIVRHTGSVYDIEVADCHSFVAGDLIVHNCGTHHRTHLGIHAMPGPLWELLRVWKDSTPPPAMTI